MGAQENKLQKLQISLNDFLRMTILPVFCQFLWNLKFISSGSHKNLIFGVISYNFTFIALIKSVKKNAIGHKILWYSVYKVFVHRKLKLLIFLMDSVLIASYIFGLLDHYQPLTFNNCTCMYDIFWNIVVDCKSSIKPPSSLISSLFSEERS